MGGETLAVLEENEDFEPRLLYIDPPDRVIHSDENSANEDESGLINNLTGRQLNAGCEVGLTSTRQPH